MSWTDERVELLKKLWADGLSASQIAKQMRGVSRMAVIGKVHRLGLSGRAAPSKPQRTMFNAPRAARVATTAPSAPAVPQHRTYGRIAMTPPVSPVLPATVAASKPPPPIRYVAEEPGMATVLTLGPHMCKWPIGDPLEPGFTYCGRRTEAKGSYCREHAQLAHEPAQPKKKTSAAELARSLRRYL